MSERKRTKAEQKAIELKSKMNAVIINIGSCYKPTQFYSAVLHTSISMPYAKGAIKLLKDAGFEWDKKGKFWFAEGDRKTEMTARVDELKMTVVKQQAADAREKAKSAAKVQKPGDWIHENDWEDAIHGPLGAASSWKSGGVTYYRSR